MFNLTKPDKSGRSRFAFFSLFAMAAVAFSSPAWGTINAVGKSFTPASIIAGATSTITINITNSPPGNPNSIAFTDNYPAGLTNTAVPVDNGNCGVAPTGAVGGGSVALSGGSISGNKICTITVTVTACVAGSYTNPSFDVTSSDPTLTVPATTLTVTPDIVSAATSTVGAIPVSVPANGTTTSTITVTLRDACGNPVSGKTVTLAAGSGSSIISAASGPSNASGMVTFTVRDSVAEAVTYTATDTTDAITITQTATVTFTRITAPTVAKNFAPATIAANGTSTLAVTLTNPNATPINSVAFTDTYPAGLVNAAAPALTNSCGGAPTAAGGGNTLSLSGGTIAGSSSCTLTVQVTSAATGNYVNSTGAVTSSNANPGVTASATLTVRAISAALSTVVAAPLSVTADGITTSTITVTLKDGAGNPVAGKTVTLAAGSGSSIISPASGPSNASGIVTFTVTDLVVEAVTYTATDTTDAIVITQTATVTFTRITAPTVVKSFSPTTIVVSGASTLTVTLTNPNATPINSVAFTDTYPAGLVNAAAPALTNSCGGTPTAAGGGNTLSLSGGAIAGSSSCTLTVQVTSAATGSYVNSTGAVTSSNANPGVAASATLTVIAAVSSFNAFESTTGAGAIVGVIKTRISGSVFSLDVVAISGGAQSAGFTNTVKVELLGNTVTGIALDAQNCPTSSTLLQTVAPNPTITTGRSTINFAAVADAWKDVRVRISYPVAAPTVITCSTDNFAIRPSSFASASVTDNDWQTAGIARPLANTAAVGGNMHKAGQPFTVRATAVNAVAATTTNYTGTPIALLTACAGTACTATFGAAPVVSAAVLGVITTNTAIYNEVGSFNLQLQDQTFANVDAADSTTAQRYISSAVIGVGRFVPDHFSLSAASIVNRADLVCPGCTFTYMGEQLNAVFTLTAQAAGGSTTQNYAGVLAKLNPAAAGNPLVFGAVDTATPTYLTARLDTSLAASGGFALGMATVSAPLGVARCTAVTCPANTNPNLEDGPYAALDIGIAPVDSDGVTMAAYDLDTDAVVGNDHTKVAQTEVRYGRMKLSSAYGSELLSLPIAATIQHWDGTTYATSVTDSATQFNTNLVPGGNVQAVIVKGPLVLADVVVVTPGLVTFTNGLKTFKLAAPNKAGSVDLTIVTAPSYLLPSTTGRATFGVYKGANEFIYLRENY